MIRLLTAVTLGAALAAQAKVSPNRFVPKDSVLVARLGAPAVWKRQFAKTKVARLFEGPTLAPLMAEASKGFDAALATAEKEGKLAPELVKGLFEDYAGEIVIALQVDWDDLPAAMREDRPPLVSLVFALTPDGKFDLTALAAGLQKVAEAQSSLRDLTVGDQKLRYEDGELQVSLPTMIDGHLVTLAANDLAKHAAKLLGTGDRFEGGASGAPLHVHAQLDRAVASLLASMAELMDEAPDMPFDPIALMRSASGMDCLKALDLSVNADGEHVVAEITLATKDGERGMLGALLFDHGPSKLLRFVPPSAAAFSCMPLDLGALYRTVAKVWTDLGDEVPMTFAAVEKEFLEGTKVRLKEDLIDHLGTELLSISDVRAQFAAIGSIDEMEEPDPSQMFAGSCYAVALRNGKSFGESLEKALRSRGLHAARKSEEYQGTKVHRLKLAAIFELEYAVTDDLLLLAAGSDDAARQHLRGMLDARASGATAPPEAVAKRLQGMPDGWNGAGVTPIAAVLHGMGTVVKQAAEQESIPDEALQVVELLIPLAADLERRGLGDMVGATWSSKNGITSRMRW